jgi:SPP1 family predicted phage head-tail adaptor
MAITKTIPAGLINKPVIFKQPTITQNNEGGQEVEYSTGLETRAHVTKFNQFRGTEANVTALIGARDFYIRYRAAADAVNKDWLIEYKGEDYVIHEIEPLDQEERFIRFTAKSKGTSLSG